MKKWKAVVLVCAIAAAGASIILVVLYRPVATVELESLVPDEAVHYFYSYNLRKTVKDFGSSLFYQKISDVPVYKRIVNPHIEKFQNKLFGFGDFFDSDAALAVFSSGVLTPKPANPVNKQELSDFIFLARINFKESIKKVIGGFYLSFKKKGNINQEKYKGVEIVNYELLGENNELISNVYYAFLGKVLAISNKDAYIRKSIDLFKKDSEKSLLSDEDFMVCTKNHKSVKKDVLLWMYTHQKYYYSRLFFETAKNHIQEGEDSSYEGLGIHKVDGLLDELSNITIGTVSYLDYDQLKEGIVWESYNFYDKSKDKNNFLGIFNPEKDMESDILEMVPYDAFGYSGVSFDLKTGWDYIKGFMPDSGGVEQKKEIFLGLDLEEDVFPLLASNFSAAVYDIWENSDTFSQGQIIPRQLSFLPFLKFSVFIEAKDYQESEKLSELISVKVIPALAELLKQRAADKLIKEGISVQPQESSDWIKLRTEDYAGVSIKIASIKDFPLEFSYCVVDKYLVISYPLEAAERVINTSKGDYVSLLSHFNSGYQKDKISSAYSYISFLNSGILLDKITGFTLFNFCKLFVPVFTGGVISVDDIDSIIDVLADISLLNQYCEFTGDGVAESFFYIKIKGL